MNVVHSRFIRSYFLLPSWKIRIKVAFNYEPYGTRLLGWTVKVFQFVNNWLFIRWTFPFVFAQAKRYLFPLKLLTNQEKRFVTVHPKLSFAILFFVTLSSKWWKKKVQHYLPTHWPGAADCIVLTYG